MTTEHTECTEPKHRIFSVVSMPLVADVETETQLRHDRWRRVTPPTTVICPLNTVRATRVIPLPSLLRSRTPVIPSVSVPGARLPSASHGPLARASGSRVRWEPGPER